MPQTRSTTKETFVPIATDNVFLGDCSYSMKSTNGGSQEGAVGYMQNQYDNAKKMTYVKGNALQYVAFDNNVTQIFSGDASVITEEDYDNVYDKMKPVGGTALYDAVCRFLGEQMDRLDTLKNSLAKEVRALVNDNPRLIGASFAIMTDGKDNRSEKTDKDCKELIEKYKKQYGGVVLFIAANHDAEQYATILGIDKKNALQMGNDRSSSIEAAKVVSQAQYRSASSQDVQDIPMFTQNERSISNSQSIDMSIPFPPVDGRSRCRSGGGIPFPAMDNSTRNYAMGGSKFEFPPLEEGVEEKSYCAVPSHPFTMGDHIQLSI